MAARRKQEPFVSLAEIAKAFGYSHNYLCRLAANGAIKAHRIGRMWITTHREVERYLSAAPKGKTGHRRRGGARVRKHHT